MSAHWAWACLLADLGAVESGCLVSDPAPHNPPAVSLLCIYVCTCAEGCVSPHPSLLHAVLKFLWLAVSCTLPDLSARCAVCCVLCCLQGEDATASAQGSSMGNYRRQPAMPCDVAPTPVPAFESRTCVRPKEVEPLVSGAAAGSCCLWSEGKSRMDMLLRGHARSVQLAVQVWQLQQGGVFTVPLWGMGRVAGLVCVGR